MAAVVILRTFISQLQLISIFMKHFIQVLLFIGFVTGIYSCNTTKQQSHKQNITDIHGKRWILARFTDTVVNKPEKPIYLLFEKDSLRVTGFSGCNGLRGTYQIKGEIMEFGPVVSTKMWCNHAATEAYFLRTLEQTTSYHATDDTLFLLLEDYILASFYPDPIP